MKYNSTYLVACVAILCSGCVIPYKEHVPVVKGRAVDVGSGQPISNVTVELRGFPATKHAGRADGTFETQPTECWHVFSMPLGDRMYSYQLCVTAPGYEDASRPISVFRCTVEDMGNINLKKRAEPSAAADARKSPRVSEP